MSRTSTWSNIGKSVESCKNMEQVMKAAHLDYNVGLKPVFAGINETKQQVPNRFVTFRESDGHMYDIVSDKYRVVQNSEAFDFVNFMNSDITYEKAGETESGMVYIIAKLPSVNILGDEFTPHAIFRNGFGGKIKITAAICPLRIVCENQFNFAFKNTQNSITVRHVGNASAKLEEAKHVLKMSADYMDELNRQAQIYAGTKMDPAQIERVVNWLFPVPAEEVDMNSFARFQLQTAKDKFITAYNADDNYNFRGSAWGIINAYADYITHKEPMGNKSSKEENKFITTVFHPALMNKILDLVRAAA